MVGAGWEPGVDERVQPLVVMLSEAGPGQGMPVIQLGGGSWATGSSMRGLAGQGAGLPPSERDLTAEIVRWSTIPPKLRGVEPDTAAGNHRAVGLS